MKMTVILAVLFASLLAVTGVASATTNCCADQCFKVTATATDTTNPANSFTDDWSICYDDISAVVCNGGGPLFTVSEFHGGLNFQVISFNNPKGAYMTFHGGAFNGIYYDGANRFKIHGVEEECDFH